MNTDIDSHDHTIRYHTMKGVASDINDEPLANSIFMSVYRPLDLTVINRTAQDFR